MFRLVPKVNRVKPSRARGAHVVLRRIVDNAEAQHQILAEWESRPANERNRTNSWSGVEKVQHGAPVDEHGHLLSGAKFELA